MRYDQPPYPCPGCGNPRKISTPEDCGSGQPVAYCPNCPAQDAKGNPLGVLCLSWAEVVREVLRRAGKSVGEELDSLAGLVPRESREGIGVEIRECWQEQTRNRGGKGGSSSKGRKKSVKGGAVFLGGNDDGGEDKKRDKGVRGPKSNLKSSVHSARLTGPDRRELQGLTEKLGVSESEVLVQGVRLLAAVEAARPGQEQSRREEAARRVLEQALVQPGIRIGIAAANARIGRQVLAHTLLNAAALAGIPVRYEPSKQRLAFDNGSCAYFFSAQAPEGVRGCEFGMAWVDDLWACGEPPRTWRWETIDGEQVKVYGEPVLLENLRYAVRQGDALFVQS